MAELDDGSDRMDCIASITGRHRRCFLCLMKLLPNSMETVSSPIFHCLLRHLKIKPEEEVKRSESELAMMGMGDADVVQMCQQCSELTQRFSSAFQQLERFELEAGFYLRLIGDKMKSVKGEDMERKEQKQLGRLGELREKAKEKCTDRLNNSAQPRVHVYNMTAEEVSMKTSKRSSTMAPVNEETIPLATSYYGSSGDLDNSILETDMVVKIDPESIIGEYWESSTDHPDGTYNEDEMDYEEFNADHIGGTDHEMEDGEFNIDYAAVLEDHFLFRDYSDPVTDLPVPVKPSQPSKEPEKLKAYKAIRGSKTSCEICGIRVTYELPHYLAYHESPRMQYNCPLCYRGYAQKDDLRFHQMERDCTAPKLLQKLSSRSRCNCSCCDQDFYSLGKLRDHLEQMRVHWRHECELCGKQFKWKNSFVKHKRTKHALPG